MLVVSACSVNDGRGCPRGGRGSTPGWRACAQAAARARARGRRRVSALFVLAGLALLVLGDARLSAMQGPHRGPVRSASRGAWKRRDTLCVRLVRTSPRDDSRPKGPGTTRRSVLRRQRFKRTERAGPPPRRLPTRRAAPTSARHEHARDERRAHGPAVPAALEEIPAGIGFSARPLATPQGQFELWEAERRRPRRPGIRRGAPTDRQLATPAASPRSWPSAFGRARRRRDRVHRAQRRHADGARASLRTPRPSSSSPATAVSTRCSTARGPRRCSASSPAAARACPRALGCRATRSRPRARSLPAVRGGSRSGAPMAVLSASPPGSGSTPS